MVVIDDGCLIGDDIKIWYFCYVMLGVMIGEKCFFGQNVFVVNDVMIGNGVKIQNNVLVYEGVVLDDYVFCGFSMVFINVVIFCVVFFWNIKDDYLWIYVGMGVSFGVNCMIVCGNLVGVWFFVVVGVVVMKDVFEFVFMVGVFV